MDLLRHWRRRVFGAAAAAVIAPVAVLLAALAVGVGGGGLDSLGALGQAFAGPQLPDDAALPARGGPNAAEAGRLLARVQRDESRAAGPSSGGGGGNGGGSAGTRVGAGGGGQRTGSTNPPGRPGGSVSPNPTPAPSSGAQPTPAPTPTPAPSPSTVRQVGNEVHEVTDPVPVVGPPAGEVVDLIVDTAEQLPLP